MVSGNDKAGTQPVRAGIPKQARPETDTAVLEPTQVFEPTVAADTVIEPSAVTHTTKGSFLLVEYPTPWAGESLESPGLPTPVGDLLAAYAERNGAHVVLIQRPDGELSGSTTVFISVAEHDGLIVQACFDQISDLLEEDLDGVLRQAAACQIAEGWVEGEPVLLVPTNRSSSQRLHGQAIAALLHSYDPENVWESSHSFGAAHDVSVLVLPSTQLYAPVQPGDAKPLVSAAWRGSVYVDKFVGRLSTGAPQQLAEAALRRRLGASAESGILPIGMDLSPAASSDEVDHTFQIERIVTRWRVYPGLVADETLAQMSPSVASQPSTDWRVVVDRVRSQEGPGVSEHLSVIEISCEDEPGLGVVGWDDAYRTSEEPLPLPDPTLVAELSQLSPGQALDLGSGTGRHSIWLAQQGWQVTAVDFSRSGLWRLAEEAGKRYVGVRAELADLRDWTPGGVRFDLILVSHVHVQDVFKRVAPWLSDHGRVVVIGTAKDHTSDEKDAHVDYVHLAARATGARLRVLRAGEIERVTDDGTTTRDALVIARRPD